MKEIKEKVESMETGVIPSQEKVEEAEAEAAEKSAEVALVVDAQESEMSEEKKQRTEEG